MTDEYLSVDKVADLLGLHVRTVRAYVRQGRLKAVRIGKQYRIARPDLDALTTTGHAHHNGVHPENRHRNSEVTCVVQLDAIEPALANRLTTMLISACSASKDDPLKQVSCRYLESLGRLKVILNGNLDTVLALQKMIKALLEP